MVSERGLFRVKLVDVFADPINELHMRQSADNFGDFVRIAFLFTDELGVFTIVLQKLVIIAGSAKSFIF